jgi:hypothetical protein
MTHVSLRRGSDLERSLQMCESWTPCDIIQVCDCSVK